MKARLIVLILQLVVWLTQGAHTLFIENYLINDYLNEFDVLNW